MRSPCCPRYFNQMTRQLKGQRDRLLTNTQQIERRRRLFRFRARFRDLWCGGDGPEGARYLCEPRRGTAAGLARGSTDAGLKVAVPEFAACLNSSNARQSGVVRRKRSRSPGTGRQENLLVRMSTRGYPRMASCEGYVVAFDDVTDLVSAQRMAAWGDVARRIAHEIKNPLTPIQLSRSGSSANSHRQAGRSPGSEQLEQMTDVIVRQTNDLRRIVDEFSKFARMPEPDTQGRKPVGVGARSDHVAGNRSAGCPQTDFTDAERGRFRMWIWMRR